MADIRGLELDFTDLEFTSESELEYFQEAILGEEFRKFLVSAVGKHLHARAKQEYEQAKEDLLKCNPESSYGRRKEKALRQQAENADNFMRWCADAISHGEEATQMLNNVRTEDN